jgi:hypothetical protein
MVMVDVAYIGMARYAVKTPSLYPERLPLSDGRPTGAQLAGAAVCSSRELELRRSSFAARRHGSLRKVTDQWTPGPPSPGQVSELGSSWD